ncbi:LIM domain only protein 7-like isoform X4 [Odontesthes bonariensis]|uniref:LIM domain only protein 7-like isoform X4 n=1 Tax=Odontesthes bonariensis TaxID=219752 RepID=UPI003F58873F
MEWRQQTSVSCAEAFSEAQRWIEEVTGKSFGCSDFRAALENGVLLCDLINQLKPGLIKRVNRLSTPIAGLDNVTVFLKACGKLGLNDSQLFHPGDLQDLSTRVTLRRDESKRRLKNVLITIYWLGRKAQLDAFYSGPQLNFKAFEGLLGLALSKALEEGSNMFVRDGGCKEGRYPEEDECRSTSQSYKRGNLMDGIESLDNRAVQPNDEGCGSDAEAEQVFRMENTQPSVLQNKGYIPPPIGRKQGLEEKTGVCVSPLPRIYQIQVRPERPVQVNPGWIWSKSLSDIPMVYPVRKVSHGNSIYDKGQDTSLSRDWNQENKRKCSSAVKDSEAQWQDDLTKWKNLRRSTKSDLHRKSQDREHVMTQMTNGAMTHSDKNAVQRGPIKRDQSPWRYSSAPRPYSTCSPSKPSGSDLRPHTRALLARSYATDAPFSPTTHTQGSSHGAMPSSNEKSLGEETYFTSLASDGAGVTTPSLDCPFISQTQPDENAKSTSSRDPASSMSSRDTDRPSIGLKGETFCPDAVNQAGLDATEDSSRQYHTSQEENQKSFGNQQETTYPKYLSRTRLWSSTASLPRGYRRSEGSSRLSSAVTAKPFGTKQSRVSSLPRLFKVDDSQGLLLKNEKEDFLSSSTKQSLKRQTAAAHLRGQYQATVRQSKANQARQNGTDQREDVNGSSFFSQTSFQNNGHSHLPQPYSSLQPHQSKSLSFPSNISSELLKMDHSDMRVSLTLKPNSVPDFGFHTHWDSTGTRLTFVKPGSPAELCRLCVDDEIVSVDGVAVAYMTYNQWKDKMASSLQTGSLTMDIRRYGIKDWSTTRHCNQPGQSRMTLNLTAAAPVLIGCPDHHSNNAAPTETTDAQVSKFDAQTDNVLQGNTAGGVLSHHTSTAKSKDYISITRNNQKRRAEFFKQKGGSESAISDLQVPSLSPSSSNWSWDREEDRRRQEKWQEEQERLLKEQYQRDQERLEAEWRRAQQDASEGRKSRQNTSEMASSRKSFASTEFYVNGLKKTREEELSPERGELKKAGPQRVQNEEIAEKDWAEGSYGFAQLSPAHRGMSLSTPVLAGPYTQTGDQRKRKGQSKAEQERQQILEEMKKRTQLLTDNSWIRQRSSSFHKEPISVGVSMKRYESLDNLDALRQPPDSAGAFTYTRSHSTAGGYCAPTRNASSRYSTGSLSFQRNAHTESSHHGSVNMCRPRMISGRRTCCVCERVLGSGAAMVIEALSLCFHLTCFQCVSCHRHLGGTETGVQIRICDRKPYCDHCYIQLKSSAALIM